MGTGRAMWGAGHDEDHSQARFFLERFAWASPERLEVSGRWTGVSEERVGIPDLVFEFEDHLIRLTALKCDTEPAGDELRWSAMFFWPGRPGAVGESQLEFPDGTVVELPALGPERPRFGRRFARGRREPAAAVPVHEGSDAADAPPETADAAERSPPPPAPVVAEDEDPLAVHARLVRALDELAEAREELDRASADLERVRTGRRADADRQRAELGTARALAERRIEEERAELAEAVERERALGQRLRTELERAEQRGLQAEARAAQVEDLREALSAAEGRAGQVDELRDALRSAREALEATLEREERLRKREERLRRALDELLPTE